MRKKTGLGLRIDELRKKRNMIQDDLAKMLNVSKSLVVGWETGTRDPDSAMITKLANFFGVTTDFLLGQSDHPLINDSVLELRNWHKLESLIIDIKKLDPELIDALSVVIKSILEQSKVKEERNEPR